jgi:3-deoxy-D-manno-octulosonic acid kinase
MRGAELPEGFVWRSFGRYRGAVRDDPALLALAGPDQLAAASDAVFTGRGRPRRVALPDGGSGVLREYRHGGLFRGLTRGLFTGRPRPLRELFAIETARRAGVATPEILAAWHRPVALLFHTGYLLTREVEGACDLVSALGSGAAPGPLLAAVGREMRRMHASGVWHADLHVKNVLVSGGDVTLIDFDRARGPAPVSAAAAEDNLLRFDRSVVKLGRAGAAIPDRDRLRFFHAYYAGDLSRTRRDELRRRCARHLAWHRLMWRLLPG